MPPPDPPTDASREKLRASRHLIPVVLLIVAVLGSIYAGIATATEAAALGVRRRAAHLGARRARSTWQTLPRQPDGRARGSTA